LIHLEKRGRAFARLTNKVIEKQKRKPRQSKALAVSYKEYIKSISEPEAEEPNKEMHDISKKKAAAE